MTTSEIHEKMKGLVFVYIDSKRQYDELYHQYIQELINDGVIPPLNSTVIWKNWYGKDKVAHLINYRPNTPFSNSSAFEIQGECLKLTKDGKVGKKSEWIYSVLNSKPRIATEEEIKLFLFKK